MGLTFGLAIGLQRLPAMSLAVFLGFVFGFGLGLRPLLKAKFSLSRAIKQVLIAEGVSIFVMETAEVLVELYTPGVMDSGILSPIYWMGMALALTAGFAAAFPVNYYLVTKGIRHHH